MSIQLPLAVSLAFEPTLDNFLVGENTELLSYIQSIAAGREIPVALYVWGESGTGKTHLLKALSIQNNARIVDHEMLLNSDLLLDGHRILLIDDVERLNNQQQVGLFHLYNAVKLMHANHDEQKSLPCLVIFGGLPPKSFPDGYLKDLQGRMEWQLIYELHVLNDVQKKLALIHQAQAKGLELKEGVVEYMLRHLSRNMSDLGLILEQLDYWSLTKQHAITLHLLRDFLDNQTSHQIEQ